MKNKLTEKNWINEKQLIFFSLALFLAFLLGYSCANINLGNINQNKALIHVAVLIIIFIIMTWCSKKHNKINQALFNSEERFKILVDSMSDIVFTLDKKLRCSGIYGNWIKRYGLAPEMFLGKTVDEIMGQEGNEQHLALFQEALVGRNVIYEWSISSIIGLRYIQTSLSPLKNHKGEIIGIVGLGRDITEQKLTEDDLRQSKEKLRLITDSLPVLISYFDSQERYHFNNKSYSEWLGIPAENMNGKSVKEVFGEIAYSKLQPYIEQALLGQKVQFETELIYKKGDKRFVQVTYIPNIQDNNVQGVFVLVNDLTKQKLLDKEYARIDRLKTVGKMAATIAHEIRNPLTAVRGFCQYIKNKSNEPQFENYFNLMIEELDRANNIIEEYLSLARIRKVELKDVSLNTIVNSIYPLIYSEATEKNKNISLALEEIPEISLNGQEIRQLIYNLAKNGLEAMDSGGVLTISTYQTKNAVVLAIRDQGEGIDSAIINEIGNPFFTTKTNGTGLGLSVCYDIALRHNAKIDIETSSAGTTVSVYFEKNYN